MPANPFSALNAACIRNFGSPITYQQGTGTPFAVAGIFQQETDEDRHADGVYARLFVKLADFPAVPDHGDLATVNGTTYTVFQVLVDPTGAGALSLKQHG